MGLTKIREKKVEVVAPERKLGGGYRSLFGRYRQRGVVAIE